MITKLALVLLAAWVAFSLPGCIERAGSPQGNSNTGKVSSVSGAERNPGSPQLPCDKKSSAGGYRLIARKDYPYGSGPDDFGIERGVPPDACGGFSAGGPEGNLYVLDLVNRNVKVLRKADAALVKVVKLPAEVMGEGSGLPWNVDIAVDKDGVIYVLAAAAGRVQVVAFDDTGKVLSVRPFPEGSSPIKTREGRVVVAKGDQGWDCSFAGCRYRIEIKGNGREAVEFSRFEGSSRTGLGRYRVAGGEEAIASAGLIGEDRSGNAYVWVQVEKPPLRPESPGPPKDVRLGVLKFSEKGKLLDILFVPEDDYFAMYIPKFFDVGQDGTIYQVIPAEKRLKVRIWALR